MTGRLIEEKAVLDLAHDIVIGDYRHRCIDPSAVRELPTVEAIPVEWVKTWIFEHPYFYVTGSTLLGDWQKEQRKEE